MSGGGTATACCYSAGDGQAGSRPPVLYAHGIQSHPGWFSGSAAFLAQRGHSVYCLTRRGSGDSPALRGHASSAGQLLADVEAAMEFIQQRTQAPRVHLVGVSWGGKLLAAYAAQEAAGRKIASLTLVAPGLAPRVDVSAWTKLRIAMSLLAAPRRLFDIPLSDVELFTDNPQMRQYLRDDPLRLLRATARFLYASRCLDRQMARLPRGALKMPVALLLARTDRIIDNPQTLAMVERLTDGRAVVQEFDGCHTLEFESDPRPFFEAVAASLDRAERCRET